MITRWEVVCVLLVAAGIAVGWLLGHYRAYAECCDCCTCQTCATVEHFDEWASGQFTHVGEADEEPLSDFKYENRRTVVLEPGPTIYPALAELAGEVIDGPHSDPEPIDSTWLRLLMLDWDRRYPIPQEAR